MVVNIQKFLDVGHISSFIRLINCIFEYDGKRLPAFCLDFSRVEKVDLLGVLLTYKVLEYSTVHHCFISPSHNIYSNDLLMNTIDRFGFEDLIRLLMSSKNNETTKEYKKLRVRNENDCVIAPIALLRTEHYHSELVIKNKYEPIITGFYQKSAVVEMILEVFTEIMHNFWAHATDEKSIITGYGNKNFFEIACVDNGLGIDGTINSSFPKYKDEKALLYAMSRGVTSKVGTNHMGYGLWFINEVVKRARGTLQIISNKLVFSSRNGRQGVQSFPYWHGTIVYVKIPLNNPITIKDVESEHLALNEINVNFI